MAEISSNVHNIAIRVRVLLSFIDRMQVDRSKLHNTAVVGTHGVPLPVHNIIVAVEQAIPDLQNIWTRFSDNRRVYAIYMDTKTNNFTTLALRVRGNITIAKEVGGSYFIVTKKCYIKKDLNCHLECTDVSFNPSPESKSDTRIDR